MSKVLSLLAVVALMTAMLAGCGAKEEPTPTETAPVGATTITVVVTHKDGSTNTVDINTNEETLGRAMVTAGLVEDNQSTYGLYILTADGETVDEANQEWWCITKGGESVMVGADELAIEDGDVFELTFTVGW